MHLIGFLEIGWVLLASLVRMVTLLALVPLQTFFKPTAFWLE